MPSNAHAQVRTVDLAAFLSTTQEKENGSNNVLNTKLLFTRALGHRIYFFGMETIRISPPYLFIRSSGVLYQRTYKNLWLSRVDFCGLFHGRLQCLMIGKGTIVFCRIKCD